MIENEILLYPNPKLRIPTMPVDFAKVEEETLNVLSSAMLQILPKVKGLAITANQIGIDMSMFVANVEGKVHVIVNPIVTTHAGNYKSKEGCLSFPAYMDTVDRYAEMTVDYQNTKGEYQKVFVEGLTAAVFQHEIDHLQGKFFIDHLPEHRQERAKKKLKFWKRRNTK